MHFALSHWPVRLFTLSRGVGSRHYAACGVIACILWAAIVLALQSAHDRTLDRAGTERRNLARSFAEHVASSVRAIDLSLLHLRDEWIDDRAGFGAAVARQQEYLKRESVVQVGVTDAGGRVIWNSTPGWRPVDVSDLAHIRVHRERSGDELYISTPVMGRVSKQWVIQFTRPIYDASRRFAGVLTFSVPPIALQQVYNDIDLGEGGRVGVVRADGQFLAHSQNLPGAVSTPLAATTPGLRPNDPDSGEYRRASTLGGIESLFSYRKVPAYPLVVYVAQPVDTVLAPYYAQRTTYVASGLLVTALLVGLTLLLIAKERDRQSAELSRARLAAVVDSANDAIMSRDLDGRILSWNAAAERLLGYTAAEVIGKDTVDLLTPTELIPEVLERRRLAREGKLLADHETVRIAKDGRRIDVSISVSPIRDDRGAVIGNSSVWRDITEQVQTKKALQRSEAELQRLNAELESRVAQRTAELELVNQELGSFSYSVAHDLRAPLRAINGFSAMVAEANRDRLDQASLDQLKRIQTNGERMGGLVDDLLNLTRVSRQTMQLQTVDLSALADSVVAALREAHPERVVQVSVQTGMRVTADRGLMEVVLDNLIGNAWKFTAATAGARIDVGAEQRDGATTYYVRDNGAGFDMQYAHKLFLPFQRLHGREEFEGSGIGLSLVKRIVTKHGGKVWAVAAPGSGATFCFTLG